MENLNLVCPAKCHPLQLETPKGRVLRPGHGYKSINTFAITLKESEKTPKYRNYMKRENLNLVCPAKCHPLQLETPERARCTPLARDSVKGAFYAPRPCYKSETEHFCDNFKGIRENSEIPKLHEKENLNLVCPAKCHPLQLETPERARCTPSAMATKVKRSTFAITLKESEKTPKYRNYMKRENLNLVCPAKCHPLQLETPERARCTPLGVA
ncbi:hypothetical protein Fcan01_28729 [Folsomia candida]|uniref:Uncharacterized protein n=1 Tax=Folsomia candida TaxID=158441 RepID=A0A226CWU7_FOLCA|nr:hypothetical protein Fcan01_28729 [Folsomia candida]